MTAGQHSAADTGKFFITACVLFGGLAFLLAEVFYRVYLYNNERAVSGGGGGIYQIYNENYGEFDERHGVRYIPNVRISSTFVDNGKVVGCIGEVLVTNEDGLVGRTTIKEYDTAQLKILTFGDSYTMLHREGGTIPDLVEAKLEERLGIEAANLNYAYGGKGILHMMSMAADKIEIHRPDLAIVQFITDDVTRARWWRKTIEPAADNPASASLMSPLPDFDVTLSSPEAFFVHPSADAQWCEEALNKEDALVEETEMLYNELRAEKKQALRRKYMTPFRLFAAEAFGLAPDSPFQVTDALPRITYQDYAHDERFLADVERIRASGVPLLLIHIPLVHEITANSITPYPADPGKDNVEQLLKSLRGHTGERMHTLLSFTTDRPLPSVDIYLFPPYDLHPSAILMDYYADMISEIVATTQADLINEKKL